MENTHSKQKKYKPQKLRHKLVISQSHFWALLVVIDTIYHTLLKIEILSHRTN